MATQDMLAVYHELLKNPNVDPKRIYISGTSAGSAVAAELVEGSSDLWRGASLLSPVSFPRLPVRAAGFPSIFISIGENDLAPTRERAELFAQAAFRQGIPVRLVSHPLNGHTLESTGAIKLRYGALAQFILSGR